MKWWNPEQVKQHYVVPANLQLPTSEQSSNIQQERWTIIQNAVYIQKRNDRVVVLRVNIQQVCTSFAEVKNGSFLLMSNEEHVMSIEIHHATLIVIMVDGNMNDIVHNIALDT